MFLGINNNSMQFVTDYNNSFPRPLYYYLYLPQGWSLGVELFFYLLAPFILSKINLGKIIIIILLSISVRIILIQSNLTHDPWSYRFFPTELMFFLFGSISYIFYKKKYDLYAGIIIFFVILILSIISYLFLQKFADRMRDRLKINKINSNIKKSL
jgi:peptidoglycan/LPS O-acetylase OafA/YrhL